MKSKELISQILEADPSGELECCVGNIDIHFVGSEPVYYDGYLQKLIRDESKSPYYNIVGGSYGGGESEKIVIHTLSISDAICNDVEIPVDYSHLSAQTAKRYKEYDDDRRKEMIAIRDRIERDYFFSWVKDVFGIKEISREETDALYKELGLKESDPLAKNILQKDEHGNKWHQSYVDRRLNSWTNTIKLDINEEGKVVAFRKYIPGEENAGN